MGTSGNEPPFNATTKEEEIIGLERDLGERIATAMGVDLNVPFPYQIHLRDKRALSVKRSR